LQQKKRGKEIKKLRDVIRDKNLVKTNNSRPRTKIFDLENPPSGGIITAYSIYPAIQVLWD
jgi:hypothetical protein